MNMEKTLARRAEISRVDSPGKVQVQALGGQVLEAERALPWVLPHNPALAPKAWWFLWAPVPPVCWVKAPKAPLRWLLGR